MVKGLLIDFGGTVDTDGIHWFRVFEAAYRECGAGVPVELLRQAYVHAERTLGKTALIGTDFTFSRTLETKIVLQTEFLEQEGLHIGCRGEILDFCMNLVRDNINKVSGPVLERLAASMPIALVSNFYGNMHRVLGEFGIEGHFADVVESAVVGLRKPDMQIFTLACSRLGLTPDSVLMAGDSWDKDILPAHEAGCRTCWLNRGKGYDMASDSNSNMQADAQIDSLSCLGSVIFDKFAKN